MEEEILVRQCRCQKCSHKWIPRIEGRPVQCPKCKRTDWDVPSNSNKK